MNQKERMIKLYKDLRYDVQKYSFAYDASRRRIEKINSVLLKLKLTPSFSQEQLLFSILRERIEHEEEYCKSNMSNINRINYRILDVKEWLIQYGLNPLEI